MNNENKNTMGTIYQTIKEHGIDLIGATIESIEVVELPKLDGDQDVYRKELRIVTRSNAEQGYKI